MENKWGRGIVVLFCILALVGVALYGVWKIWFDPYRGTVNSFGPTEKLETVLPSSQGVEDLDYLVQRLAERHPACMKGLPEKVQAEYEGERKNIASAPEVSVLSLWQSMARILGSLGDAHTVVGVNYENEPRLPFHFVWKNDVLLCSGGDYDGYTVLEIENEKIVDLYNTFLTQFSYELDAWARHSFASRLNGKEFLSFIGLDAQEEVSLLLESPRDGRPIPVSIGLQGNSLENDIENNIENNLDNNIKNHTQENDKEEFPPHFEYAFKPAEGVGIFTLHQCVYDESYKAGLQNFFQKVEENNIHSVIVDLRGNPGGNSLVGYEFISYLPVESYLTGSSQVRLGPILINNKPQGQKNSPQKEPVFKGDVYVLTGADTFSAAMDFAVLISDNGLGTIVGESPGNMPSSYGDILRFQTPNAGLIFSVSYKYFERPDSSKSHIPLLPDVVVPAEDALTEAMRLIGVSGE